MPDNTPRHRLGALCIASDAPTPHSPPDPINRPQKQEDGVVRAKPHSNSNTEKKTTFAIRGRRRS